jgi:quercetin dioxygenase-like cupin family protein
MEDAPGTFMVDLAEHFDAHGDGVQWALPEPSDLNANLVHLDAGSSVPEHVNREVDVLLVVLAGSGTLQVGDRALVLGPLAVAHITKGASRAIDAGEGGLSYVTVHRRRGPLQVRSSVRSGQSEPRSGTRS